VIETGIEISSVEAGGQLGGEAELRGWRGFGSFLHRVGQKLWGILDFYLCLGHLPRVHLSQPVLLTIHLIVPVIPIIPINTVIRIAVILIILIVVSIIPICKITIILI